MRIVLALAFADCLFVLLDARGVTETVILVVLVVNFLEIWYNFIQYVIIVESAIQFLIAENFWREAMICFFEFFQVFV